MTERFIDKSGGRITKFGEIEFREVKPHNRQFELDEIVFSCKDFSFHLEKMDDGCFWIGIRDHKNKQAVHCNIFSKNGKAHIDGNFYGA